MNGGTLLPIIRYPLRWVILIQVGPGVIRKKTRIPLRLTDPFLLKFLEITRLLLTLFKARGNRVGSSFSVAYT